jgi:phage gp36-like protein
MAYVTTTDLELHILGLENLCRTTTQVDYEVLLTSFIAKAEAMINVYVSDIPEETPELIKQIAIDLVEYYVYRRADGDKIPEKVKESFETAKELLQKIKDGEIILTNTTPSTSEAPLIESEYDKVF